MILNYCFSLFNDKDYLNFLFFLESVMENYTYLHFIYIFKLIGKSLPIIRSYIFVMSVVSVTMSHFSFLILLLVSSLFLNWSFQQFIHFIDFAQEVTFGCVGSILFLSSISLISSLSFIFLWVYSIFFYLVLYAKLIISIISYML